MGYASISLPVYVSTSISLPISLLLGTDSNRFDEDIEFSWRGDCYVASYQGPGLGFQAILE